MNPELFLTALGVAMPATRAALPLVELDGRPVTVTTEWSELAVEIAFRRRSALLVAAANQPARPVAASGRVDLPWPMVVAADAPWGTGAADLALLVGTAPIESDAALDEVAAAERTRRFLELVYDGAPHPAAGTASLLDTVPFSLEGHYEVEAVLAALVDDVGVVELDIGYAAEVFTAVARVGGRSIGIVASRATLDGGRLSPAGCARAQRMVSRCVRANRPLLCLVDSSGVNAPSNAEDLDMVLQAAASMRCAPITKVVVVLGHAVGLAATVLGAVGARADAILPWPRASYALTESPPGSDPIAHAAACSVERAARHGDVMDVVHPDDTRERIIEMLDLCRGQRDYGR